MASIDALPPDQRAVLELVLRRGRSYDEIAQLLSIDRAGVRQRALAALDALGPQTRVPAQRRALITDYLLGALPDQLADDVRAHLSESASERAWARAVASELQDLSERPLPEIPDGAHPKAPAGVGASSGTPRDTGPAAAAAAGPAAAAAAGSAAAAAAEPAGQRPSSRRGGAWLLAAGAVVVLAVVLVLVLGGGSSKKKPVSHAARGTATSSTPTTSTAGSGAQIVAQINLKPPGGGSSPFGIAEVLRAQGRLGVAIAAQGLAANTKHPANAYAVWLYNSPTDSHILGFVSPAVGSSGQLRTAGGLPTNASHYQKLLLTLETRSTPRAPGRIVLEGTLTGV
jgi:Sigma-70, region 4